MQAVLRVFNNPGSSFQGHVSAAVSLHLGQQPAENTVNIRSTKPVLAQLRIEVR